MAAPTTKANPAFLPFDESYSQSEIYDTRTVGATLAVPCDAIYIPADSPTVLVTLANDGATERSFDLLKGIHKLRCKALGVSGINGVVALWR